VFRGPRRGRVSDAPRSARRLQLRGTMEIVDLCSFDSWCLKTAAFSVILSSGYRQAPPILVCAEHRDTAVKRAEEEGVRCDVFPLTR
jgi:hypothetical protein